jgi:hypothetical protein
MCYIDGQKNKYSSTNGYLKYDSLSVKLITNLQLEPKSRMATLYLTLQYIFIVYRIII